MTTEQMDWLDDHDPKWQAKLRGRRGYPMYRCRGCGVWPLVADLVEGRHGHVIHGDMMTPPELCGPVDAIEYRRWSIRPDVRLVRLLDWRVLRQSRAVASTSSRFHASACELSLVDTNDLNATNSTPMRYLRQERGGRD